MHVRRDVFDTSLFGTPDQVGLVRGLAEIFSASSGSSKKTSTSETVLALPIDGVDSSRLTAFKKLCSPHTPKLILPRQECVGWASKLRCRWRSQSPPEPALSGCLSWRSISEVDDAPDAEPAGVAAVAALQLAKLAQSLPAVLASCAYRAVTAIFDPPLVTIEASAVRHCREDIVRSLRRVGRKHTAQHRDASAFCGILRRPWRKFRCDHRRQSGPYETGARTIAFGLSDRRRVRFATMRLWRSIETVACSLG